MSWWERAVRWEGTHRLAVDGTGTALLLLLTVPITTELTSGHRSPGTVLFAFALVAPLAWRRARPVGAAVAVYAVALAQLSFGYDFLVPADFAVLLALYSVTVHGPRWAHRVAIISTVVGSIVLAFSIGRGNDPVSIGGTWVFCSTVGLAVWAFGLVRRTRREAMDALVDRAHRLEIERDQQHQIATAAERSRIAREMHDIVAHSLSVIIAQSDGGRYAAEADPQAATRALGTISETGRAALADMRRLLGVLRPNSENDPATAASAGGPVIVPQPAVLDVEELVEHVRSSGLRVSLVRMGTPRQLPPGAGLTVYRICQEALTNVLKHAGPDPAVTVLVHWLPAGITLEVSDDGRGAAAVSDGQGQGLLGMRERAAMFGGAVAVGPRPGGGFRVRAQIPLPAAPRDGRPTDAPPHEA
ncbi:MAG: sensor histidine kinase [Cellulomonas sp.]